jgi:hypothetical protein
VSAPVEAKDASTQNALFGMKYTVDRNETALRFEKHACKGYAVVCFLVIKVMQDADGHHQIGFSG